MSSVNQIPVDATLPTTSQIGASEGNVAIGLPNVSGSNATTSTTIPSSTIVSPGAREIVNKDSTGLSSSAVPVTTAAAAPTSSIATPVSTTAAATTGAAASNQPIQVGTSTPIPYDGAPIVFPTKGPEVTKPLTKVFEGSDILSTTAPVIAPSSEGVVTPAIIPATNAAIGTSGTGTPAHPGILGPDTGAGIVSPVSNVDKPGEVNNILQNPGEKVGFEKCIHCGPNADHSASNHKQTPSVHAGQLNFDSHGEAYLPKGGALDDRDMSSRTGSDANALTHMNEQQRHQAQKNLEKNIMSDPNHGVLDKTKAAFNVVGHTLAAKYHGAMVKDDKTTDGENVDPTADNGTPVDLKWGGVPQHQIFTPESNSLPMTTKPGANVTVDTPATTTTQP